ncbi:MAG TPA: PCYCGC motif-containing (lipo)protein [Candidatus Acidoferrum sp.]|nr:PCYCGC motif-containing (lipo)protein [Candidatus Acidoferrum sp.]
MKTRLLVAALAVLVIVGAGGFWWFRSGASAQSVAVDEFGDKVQTVRRGQMPVFATTPEVAMLYLFATENPEAFTGVECPCGCVRIGHVNNRLCYIKAEKGDQVTYTSHAAT